MTDQGADAIGVGAGLRDYRKGNWTVEETMVLIEAKKMDDERRLKRINGDQSEGGGKSKPTELRWKWVEDYCWRKGCFRSQNQCNDKWDNLMRDYKKIRDHERRIMAEDRGQGSYWKIEKTEKKDNNLPSNMLPQIYKALVEVVENKGKLSPNLSPSIGYVVGKGGLSGGVLLQTPLMQPLLKHHCIYAPIPSSLPPPLPLPAAATLSQQPEPAQPPPMLHCPQPLPTMCGDSDSSGANEYSDSPAKRRRRGEGTSESTASASNIHEVGTAISKSASILAEALQDSEDREEKRHKEVLSLHERRLRIEESNAEVNKQGIDSLVDAINKLANSIYAMASYKNQSATPK